MLLRVLKYLIGLFKEEKPRTFFTADIHAFHKNVITYCRRPWTTKEEMNEGIVKLWNKQVKPQDTVYILGDFSLSPNKGPAFAARLNGKKILICGNHDACFKFDCLPKAARMKEKYLKQFDEVHMIMHHKLPNDEIVLLSHLPYRNEELKKYDTRYWNERPLDLGLWLLHGHQHARYVKNGKMIDVGIDHNFKLYTEEDIINIMADKRSFIPSRLTEFYKNLKKRDNMKGDI